MKQLTLKFKDMKTVNSDLIRKSKNIQKNYKLNYRPICFEQRNEVENYLASIQDKTVPIFFIKRMKLFVITHIKDKQTMIDKNFINLSKF